MSELKAYCPYANRDGFYHKSEADKVIAELKAENKRLKATPEEIMKEVFDKVLIYPHGMVRLEDAYRLAVSLRKTKRALRIARAKSAQNAVTCWCRECMERWNKVEQKCLKKAEEYK